LGSGQAHILSSAKSKIWETKTDWEQLDLQKAGFLRSSFNDIWCWIVLGYKGLSCAL
jgi:hypothetical protein